MDTRTIKRLLVAANTGAFFRPRDVEPHGVSHHHIQKLVAAGDVEKIGHGLYRLSAADATELETVAMVSAAVPGAIICLLTALSIHGIGTQLPHEIWIAIDHKRRQPVNPPARVRIIRFSGQMLTYGVVRQEMQGVSVPITSPARTVVDCFRHRNKIGMDVAMEALRDATRSRKATLDEIERAAEVCRIKSVIRPYLEALSL